jgi:hypothetical protein
MAGLAGDFSNYDDLATSIIERMHRSDITPALAAQFIDVAVQRIGKGLRTQANEANKVLFYATASNVYLLPLEFSALRFVQQIGTDDTITLDPLSQTQIDALDATGAQAMGYVLQSNVNDFDTGFERQSITQVIRTYPADGKEVTADYWVRPPTVGNELVNPNTGLKDSNGILWAYSQLFLWGALSEGYIWTNDLERAGFFDQKFDKEIKEINDFAQYNTTGTGMGVSKTSFQFPNQPYRGM